MRDDERQSGNEKGQPNKKVKIAISGKSGCGNTSVGKLLAAKRGLTFINWTFRNLAEQRGIPFEKALEMAQVDDRWDREVDARQVALAREADGCVLSSRLAIWMLKDADVKVYLRASPAVRAARIVKREGGDLAEKARFTETRDRHDHDRYLALYNIDNDRYDFADVIIETDHLSIEEVVEKIIGYVK
ncbi:MAG: cytidylate kinase family protein [Spirochaetaceae bacterium]|jgi:cytidylate kinase|nr:cytidylate kinase family protein [Spirochaetaceae bacterium]